MKAQELISLVSEGKIRLLQTEENKFATVDLDGVQEHISHLTARSAIKSLEAFQTSEGVWEKVEREERRETEVSPEVAAEVSAEVSPAAEEEKSLDDLDDEEFAKAVIAGAGRKAKTQSAGPKKSAKTDPGMYIGERRNPKSGVSKAMWDLFDALLADDPSIVLDRSMMIQICSVQNWTVSTMYCQYRWWRLARGLEVRTRAPAGSRIVKTQEEIIEAKAEAMIEESASMDDIAVIEV